MPAAAPEPYPSPDTAGRLDKDEHLEGELGDLRFRALMSDLEWANLPQQIRRRFSKRFSGARPIVYLGNGVEPRLSLAGHLLARAARLIGSPFPTSTDGGVPSVVSVTEDLANGGQMWTRLYARRAGFPQVIHSSKRFSRPTAPQDHVCPAAAITSTF